MFGYVALIALVVAFLLVIVLHAWFVRRLSTLRDQAMSARSEYERLRQEVGQTAEEVGEFSRGIDANRISIKALEAEIEEIQNRIEHFGEGGEDEH